jgi:hypothetical protein
MKDILPLSIKFGKAIAAHVGDHPQPEHIYAAIGNTASAQRA